MLQTTTIPCSESSELSSPLDSDSELAAVDNAAVPIVQEQELESLIVNMSTPTVCDLIGDESTTLLKFPLRRYSDSEVRPEFHKGVPILNVPIHQRIFKWKLDKQQLFIDTVMMNGYRASIIIVEYICNSKKYWDLEDGQQRLRTLQQFMLDAFPWNGKFYSSMAEKQKRKILNYQLSVQIYVNPSLSHKIRMFTRINTNQQKLNDNELYWSVREISPVVKFVFNELVILDGFKDYIGDVVKEHERSLKFDNETVKEKIGGQYIADGSLKEIIGLVVRLMYPIKKLTSSYVQNAPYLEIDIDESNRMKVIDFFTSYIQMIKLIKQRLVEINTRKKLNSTTFTKHLYSGVYLFMYLDKLAGTPVQNSLSDEFYIKFVCDSLSSKKSSDFTKVVFKDIKLFDTNKSLDEPEKRIDAIRAYYEEDEPHSEKRQRIV